MLELHAYQANVVTKLVFVGKFARFLQERLDQLLRRREDLALDCRDQTLLVKVIASRPFDLKNPSVNIRIISPAFAVLSKVL